MSYATKRLRENGYITMDREGLITLTDKGMSIASRMYERHKVLTALLTWLGVENLACCRASVAIYNTPEDVDALLENLENVRKVMGL